MPVSVTIALAVLVWRYVTRGVRRFREQLPEKDSPPCHHCPQGQ